MSHSIHSSGFPWRSAIESNAYSALQGYNHPRRSRSGHNFICMKHMKELQLPTRSLRNYQIVPGNCSAVQGTGICPDIPIEMQRLTIIKDFLHLCLSSIDVILGMEWISSLGWVHSHFNGLLMNFMVDREMHNF